MSMDAFNSMYISNSRSPSTARTPATAGRPLNEDVENIFFNILNYFYVKGSAW